MRAESHIQSLAPEYASRAAPPCGYLPGPQAPGLKAAHDAAMSLYDDLSKSNPAWKKIYADFAAFRDDQHLWFRFAESGFDSFMQTGREGKKK